MSDRTITLTLTQFCNLNCTYCYESCKSKHNMNVETAIKILEYEFSKPDSDRIEIDFFGGEPFIEFDNIKYIVSYMLSKEWQRDYIFFATTNGTLIHGEIAEWLRKNRDVFICGLSYDGTQIMQDINRSQSSKKISLAFFHELYADQPIKMTVSQETLPTLAEGIIYLHNQGFEVSCNLAYNIDWSKKDNVSILERQLHSLIEYYLKHPEIVPCSMLDMGIETINPQDHRYFRFCGCGITVVSYDVDGKAYPCQMFMPLSCGEEKSKQAQNIKFFSDEIPEDLVDEKCKNCIIRISCPTCYGANYNAFGNIYLHEDNYCKLYKIIIKARSYFKANQWQNGLLNLSDREEQALLRDILAIQENLL